MTNPTPSPSSTPASAPIGAVLAGAAVLAIQAIVPISNGVQPNYALMAATFLVVFGANLVASLYHVQVPSPIQQGVIAEVAALVETAVSAHTHAVTVMPAPAAIVAVAGLADVPVTPTPTAPDARIIDIPPAVSGESAAGQTP